jgi:hypothetical protein
MNTKPKSTWIIFYRFHHEKTYRPTPAICTTTKALAQFMNDMKKDCTFKITRARVSYTALSKSDTSALLASI